MQVGKAKQVYWWQSHCAERENKHVARKSLERVFGQFQRNKPIDIVYGQTDFHRSFVARKHTLKWLRIAHLVPTYTFIIYGTQRTQVAGYGVVSHTVAFQPPFVQPYFVVRNSRQGYIVFTIKQQERPYCCMVVINGRSAYAFCGSFYKAV
jgi:hypothetical protein